MMQPFKTYSLNMKGRLVTIDRPWVMGIVNVTPDSFYSGSRVEDEQTLIGRVRQMLDEGADVIDVGACSTRPGSESVDAVGEMERLQSILAVSDRQQVYFTTLEYQTICRMDGPAGLPDPGCPVLAVTGIAFPEPMLQELRRTHNIVRSVSYPDHHDFSRKDLEEIEKELDSMPSGSIILTTAKDAARLSGMDLGRSLRERIFVLPVRPAFLRDQDGFDNQIIKHVESYTQPQ